MRKSKKDGGQMRRHPEVLAAFRGEPRRMAASTALNNHPSRRGQEAAPQDDGASGSRYMEIEQ
jgi:hypothetical protein